MPTPKKVQEKLELWQRRRRIAELSKHAASYVQFGSDQTWLWDTEHALREALQIIETLKEENRG